jgi:50S ribosomal subunit-associated GTPase HflX
MWVHLSRIRGGIALRGPGETQLATEELASRRREADRLGFAALTLSAMTGQGVERLANHIREARGA